MRHIRHNLGHDGRAHPAWKSVTGQELGYAGETLLYFVPSVVLAIVMTKFYPVVR